MERAMRCSRFRLMLLRVPSDIHTYIHTYIHTRTRVAYSAENAPARTVYVLDPLMHVPRQKEVTGRTCDILRTIYRHQQQQ